MQPLLFLTGSLKGDKKPVSRHLVLLEDCLHSQEKVSTLDPGRYGIKENDLDNVGVGGKVLTEVLARRGQK